MKVADIGHSGGASLSPAEVQAGIRAHVTRKAGYKQVAKGVVAKNTWATKLRLVIEGNTAADRYRRNYYDANQRVSATMCAEKYRVAQAHPGLENGIDWSNNQRVNNRFWRQDNIRFDPDLKNSARGLSVWQRCAIRLSRLAHSCNGVTELGAAPTGMLLKSSKLFTQPNTSDQSVRSQSRVLLALVGIGAAVALFSGKVLTNTLGKFSLLAKESIQKDVSNLLGCFSAVSAISAFMSLAFGAASSLAISNARIAGALVDRVKGRQAMHLDRLNLLLKDISSKPTGLVLTATAMNKKISSGYRDPQNGNPVLLQRLLEAVKGKADDKAACAAIERTIGSYMMEADHTGKQVGKLLDLHAQKSELLTRENHVIALLNLVEHSRIDCGQEDSANDGFKDMRHRIEGAVSRGRDATMKNSKYAAKFLKWTNSSGQPDGKPSRAELEKLACNSKRFAGSADRILANPHQYGPLTRNLAKAADALRIFNHSVTLSFNYQLTRPIAWLAGRVTEGMFNQPNCRNASFSIGRFVASSAWACLDAIFFISLAGGNGVGFNGTEYPIKHKLPIKVDMGRVTIPISVVSTAAQMVLVGVPALLLMGAAKLALQAEGWKGDIARNPKSYEGRNAMLEWK